MIDPENSGSLDNAVSAALSHARSERVGLRGWRSSRLYWEVSGQSWDANLACYVVGITARPLDQPGASAAQWEYQLDEQARILPGFPVIQSLPPWDSGPGVAAAAAADHSPRFSLGLLAAVGTLALVSLIWLLTSPSPGLDASQFGPVATPTPEATPSPTPTAQPTVTPTPTSMPTPSPVPTLPPTPTPIPTSTSPPPTELPTPTIPPTIVPLPSPTFVIPTATPAPTLVPTATPPPTPTRRAPTAVPPPSLAPTVTPVPRHLLFINGNQVPRQQSLMLYAGATMRLSQAPKPDGRYANNTSVTIAVSPPPGTEVIWGGIDSQNGPFVIVEMNADRFVTIEIRTPASSTP